MIKIEMRKGRKTDNGGKVEIEENKNDSDG